MRKVSKLSYSNKLMLRSFVPPDATKGNWILNLWCEIGMTWRAQRARLAEPLSGGRGREVLSVPNPVDPTPWDN